MANKYSVANTIKERVLNQMRIHWVHLRKVEDYKEAFEMIESWINQGIKFAEQSNETEAGK